MLAAAAGESGALAYEQFEEVCRSRIHRSDFSNGDLRKLWEAILASMATFLAPGSQEVPAAAVAEYMEKSVGWMEVGPELETPRDLSAVLPADSTNSVRRWLAASPVPLTVERQPERRSSSAVNGPQRPRSPVGEPSSGQQQQMLLELSEQLIEQLDQKDAELAAVQVERDAAVQARADEKRERSELAKQIDDIAAAVQRQEAEKPSAPGAALSLQPETEVAALDLEAALADLNNKHEANLAELVRDLNEKVST